MSQKDVFIPIIEKKKEVKNNLPNFFGSAIMEMFFGSNIRMDFVHIPLILRKFALYYKTSLNLNAKLFFTGKMLTINCIKNKSDLRLADFCRWAILVFLFLNPFLFQAQEISSIKGSKTYKSYIGIVGRQIVRAQLHADGKQVFGTYTQEENQQQFPLMNEKPLNKKNEFTVKEAFYTSDEDAPYWEVKWVDGKITGYRYNGDKRQMVELEEDYPEGAHHFAYDSFTDSVVAAENEDGKFQFTTYYAYPKTNNKNLNKKIREFFHIDPNLPIRQGVQKKSEETYSDIQSDLLAFYEEQVVDEAHWFLDQKILIDYNAHDYVVLRLQEAGFYGGAHGFHANIPVVWDMQQNRALKLEDILYLDSLDLKKLLFKNLKKEQDKYKNKALKGFTVEAHELKPSEYWGIDENGIYFIYEEYALGGFAVGMPVIKIPFQELEPYIKPEFAKRMKRIPIH